MHYEIIRELKKMLVNLDKWLETATQFAQSKSFDPNVFVGMRLAPDQFPLSRQIQTACDTAKFGAARLSGKEMPSNADNEQTIEELRARVRSMVSYLDGFTAKDFEGAGARVISTPRWEGKVMSGTDYLMEHVMPNFFFHVTHCYAILRHNGVALGKMDYLGSLSLRAP
ncbi:MAG TPA: DUF1993 domain-containing protein [Polyangiales bacterium]|jgi:hypothetical protein|nr:DUF1993 domain-containing protein [Polyangiales bacterium]